MRAKRILSLLLAVMMVVTLLPVSVLAADDEESALDVIAAVEDAVASEAEDVVEETPAEEAPVEETPAEEAPAEEAPVEEAPAEEAPAEEIVFVEEAPVLEADEDGDEDDGAIFKEFPEFIIAGSGAQEINAQNVYAAIATDAAPAYDQVASVEYLSRCAQTLEFDPIEYTTEFLGTTYTYNSAKTYGDIVAELGAKWLAVGENPISIVDPDTLYATMVGTVKASFMLSDSYRAGLIDAFIATVEAGNAMSKSFAEEEGFETIRVTFKDGSTEEVDVLIVDNRINLGISYNGEVDVAYGSGSDLLSLIEPELWDDDGNAVEGLELTLSQSDASQWDVGTYTVLVSFAGDDTYRPIEVEVTVNVVKASAKLNFDYEGSHLIQYDGERHEVALVKEPGDLPVAELVFSLDVSDGVTTGIQMKVDDAFYDLIAGACKLLNMDIEEGFGLSDVTEIFDAIADVNETLGGALSSVIGDDSLVKILEGINYVREKLSLGDIRVYPVKEYSVKNIGVYVLFAVSTSTNYDMAWDMDYIVVYPDADGAKLAWNQKDCNGILLSTTYKNFDLGAKAYDCDGEELGEEVQNQVGYFMFGTDIVGDNTNGFLFMTRDLADVATIEGGAFVQIAYMNSWGNTLYYACPLIRTITVVANLELSINEGPYCYHPGVALTADEYLTWNCGCDADYITIVKNVVDEDNTLCHVNIDVSQSPCLNKLAGYLPEDCVYFNVADVVAALEDAAAKLDKDCCITQHYKTCIENLIAKIEATGFDVITINGENFPMEIGTYEVFALATAPLHLSDWTRGTVRIVSEEEWQLPLMLNTVGSLVPSADGREEAVELSIPVKVSGVVNTRALTNFELKVSVPEGLVVEDENWIATEDGCYVYYYDGEDLSAQVDEEGDLTLCSIHVKAPAAGNYAIELVGYSFGGYKLADESARKVANVSVMNIQPVVTDAGDGNYNYTFGWLDSKEIAVSASWPSEGELDNELSYQWYCDGVKDVLFGTSATYTPLISGEYYCVVTNTVSFGEAEYAATATSETFTVTITTSGGEDPEPVKTAVTIGAEDADENGNRVLTVTLSKIKNGIDIPVFVSAEGGVSEYSLVTYFNGISWTATAGKTTPSVETSKFLKRSVISWNGEAIDSDDAFFYFHLEDKDIKVGEYKIELTLFGNWSTTVNGKAPAEIKNLTVKVVEDPVYGLLGDVNNDSVVNAKDATLISKYAVGAVTSADLDLTVCDCNGDGVVNSKDATLISKYAVGMEVPNVGQLVIITGVKDNGIGEWELAPKG